jgi:hypothetical protein
MIQFIVGLEDRVSGVAGRMSKSLTTAAERTTYLTSTVKSLEKQMLKANALGNTEKVQQLAQQHGMLSSALEKSGGGASSLTKGISGLSAELGPAIAIVAAYTAVLGGLAYAFYEGAKLTLASVAFKREAVGAFTALTGSAKVGKETLGIVRDLAKSLPDTEAALVSRAKGLLAQGLDVSKLKSTLQAASNIAAGAGEEFATKFTALQERITTTGKFKFKGLALKGTGINEKDLAAQLGLPSPAALDAALKAGTISIDRGLAAMNAAASKKFGGLAMEKISTTEGFSNKLHDSLGHLFEDIDTKPFFEGLRGILHLFDASTGTGKVLKTVINSIFGGAFARSGGILLSVKHGIQDIVIAGLKLYIALKPAISSIKSLWKSAKESKNLKLALIGVAGLVGAFAAAVLIAGGIMIGLGAIVAGVAALIVLGIGWVAAKIVMFGVFIGKNLGKWGHTAKDAAANFINGIIDGINKGIAAVKSAVNKLAGALPKALADKLEIHSPSRVMMRLGEQTGEGYAQGVEKKGGRASTAVTSLASSAQSGASGGERGGGKSLSITVEKGAIVVQGGGGETLLELTETGLARLLERLALKEGLVPG